MRECKHSLSYFNIYVVLLYLCVFIYLFLMVTHPCRESKIGPFPERLLVRVHISALIRYPSPAVLERHIHKQCHMNTDYFLHNADVDENRNVHVSLQPAVIANISKSSLWWLREDSTLLRGRRCHTAAAQIIRCESSRTGGVSLW